jgi:hypothetical protein
MMKRRGVLAARMWLLSLLDAAERTGIAPLSVERLHRLVYLANAMSPVYDLLTPDGYVLKYKRGPFFPEVQWDIDRLAVQGLAAARDLRRKKDDLGWWFEAHYSLTNAGMAAVDHALRLEEAGRKAAFLREVVRAFAAILRDETAGLGSSQADAAMLEDVAFTRADAEGPIDFRTASENLTALAAGAIARRVGEDRSVGRRAEVHLYFRYLEQLWDRRQGTAVA